MFWRGEVVGGGCWDVLVVRQVIAGGAGRRRGTDEGSVIARLRRGAGPPVRLLMENDLMKDCGWMEVEVGQGDADRQRVIRLPAFLVFFILLLFLSFPLLYYSSKPASCKLLQTCSSPPMATKTKEDKKEKKGRG